MINLSRTIRSMLAAVTLCAVFGCGSSDDPGSERALPALDTASPAAGATEVPRTAWMVLRFTSDVDPKALGGIKLDCGDGTPEIARDLFGTSTVVVNPAAELAPGAACTLRWRGPKGKETLGFDVAAKGDPAVVTYDRNDHTRAYPFPDDFWLVDDASKPTGKRFSAPDIDRPDDVKSLWESLSDSANRLDGFSPLAPFVVELPVAPDKTSLPMSEAESLDPFATVGLFDIGADSPSLGRRVPFDLLVEDQTNTDGSPAHHLVIFATVPLSARGTYVLVVTRRALIDPTRPLEATEFFARVADPAGAGGTDDEKRARVNVADALSALSKTSPPLRTDDVAVAVVASIRSMDDVPRDRLAMRDQIKKAAAPTFKIDAVNPDPPASSVAAVVLGTCSLPSFRDSDFVARSADGAPVQNGTVDVPFVLALPKSAAGAPAPIVMYQHGNPGSAEAEVPSAARTGLAAAGFAVIGFTDIPNRELTKGTDAGAYALGLFTSFLSSKKPPEWLALLPNAEQMAFLRLIPELGSLDVLPSGAPDGKPELDVKAPLGYVGISQGSHRGVGFVAYAPEIKAAALVVGGGRWSATLVHQATGGPLDVPIYGLVTKYFPSVTWGEYWIGTAFAQMAGDDQEELNQAQYLYKNPHAFAATTHPSVLVTEGLLDGFVPTYSTRGAAWAFGIPQLAPAASVVPFLEQVDGPVQGNIDSATSAAFFQYVPKDVHGIPPTPGCAKLGETQGHYCAQSAEEAVAQRVQFLTSALTGVPKIVAPPAN